MVNLTQLGLDSYLWKMQENGQLANLIFIVGPKFEVQRIIQASNKY
jgi:hypothetical protein